MKKKLSIAIVPTKHQIPPLRKEKSNKAFMITYAK